METSSKNSLSFCQEDEPDSNKFCTIIHLSIRFILDELSAWDWQFASSINSAIQVTLKWTTGRCFWLFTIRIPVTANPQQTNQVTFPVRAAWFSDGPGRSRSRTLSLPRLTDFNQGHDVMTPLFFQPIRSNVTYSQKSGILENRA